MSQITSAETPGITEEKEEVAHTGICRTLLREINMRQSLKLFLVGLLFSVVLIGSSSGVFYIFARVNSSIIMENELRSLDLDHSAQLKFTANLMHKEMELIRNRMQEQFSNIRAQQRQNLLLLRHYYHNNFICIGMVTFMGILSAIFLLFISKKGWMNSNPYLLIAFLVTSSSSVFFGPLPALYGYEKTSEKLKDNYLKYTDLNNCYLSYAATESTLLTFADKSKIKTPVDFINVMDYHFKKMYMIPIFFDAGAAPKSDDILRSITGKLNAGIE